MLTMFDSETATVAEIADKASEITSALQDPATDQQTLIAVQHSVCDVLDRATLAELREHQDVLTRLVKGFGTRYKKMIIENAQARHDAVRDDRLQYWADVYATFLA